MVSCRFENERREDMKSLALNLRITGIVQGVGFRPFIYRLAKGLNLRGYVKNLGGCEVEVYIEGERDSIMRFLSKLMVKKPPTSIIDEVEIALTEIKGLKEFYIERSGLESSLPSMIPPDIGICDECLREILDPKSRWYLYPFNSCVWCGPRFSMIEKVPYDRDNTSMRDFPLCSECLREYNDPNNVRRFHAQGISCPKCGPKVKLYDNRGLPIKTSDPIGEAAKLVNEGFIVAIKGLGGYHIAALASDDDVVLKLRLRKNRPQKPIVLVPLRENSPVSKYVAPGLDMLGVMLPYTGLHYLLLLETRDKFLIMTSGNPQGKPICIDEESAFKKLRGIVDYFLVHNRRIINRVDDSVLRVTWGKPVFLRRSRGYAPTWIKTRIYFKKPVIALGAELANTAAIAYRNYIIPTQYIGDMDELENVEFLESALKFLLKTYKIDVREAIIVSDLNPVYATTKLAEKYHREYETPLVKVQHHHAHIASAMVEYGIGNPSERVIGIAIDGFGLGTDGMAWGGEVLEVSYREFKRIGHLEYQPLPGGDISTIWPTRILISILGRVLDEEEVYSLVSKFNLHGKLKYGFKELQLLLKQCKSVKLYTSGMGRILDTISALLNVCWYRSYEGEPAMKLEAYSRKGKILNHNIKITCNNGVSIVNTTDIVLWCIEKLMDNVDKPSIGKTVQYMLGYALGSIAKSSIKGRRDVIGDVVFVSGGAAVNEIIL
ncbi:MAG: carbamoyltransferase HypF, partial [Thermoprotei archaeon]